jgi:hypothetical protein
MTVVLPRVLAIMGSGETSPTMVKTHRALFARLPEAAPAVVLDTPYGFQENAPELAQRAVAYFGESVGVQIEVAGLLAPQSADALTLAEGLERVRRSHYVFSGPGSPTYALRQWHATALPALLADKLADGGVVTFASAAALTLGSHSVPVYEIYKAGEEPRWIEGLDLLAALGVHVAVVPHYDNAEGGHHDTRFCYLGERRLSALERELPDGTYVLGVDEHTGLVIDLDADVATVVGNSTVTLRRGGHSIVLPCGSQLSIGELVRGELGSSSPGSAASTAAAPAVRRVSTDVHGDGHHDLLDIAPVTSLAGATTVAQERFDAALTAGDARAAASAVLELEAALHAWSADTLQSDERDKARTALRSMVARLAGAAEVGLVPRATVVGPFVEVLLSTRAAARATGNFELADVVRGSLVELGVEVRDGAGDTAWSLKES